MQTAAVLPALGIGDALLMMIASHQLKKEGYRVTTFHDALPQLSSWFPGHDFQKTSSSKEWIKTLKSFDLILVENDNSLKINQLLDNFRSRLSLFYPTYSSRKHSPLSEKDFVFDANLSMADNISEAISSLLFLSTRSKDNGILPPGTLKYRSKENRIIIHPTSRVSEKNWKAEGFLDLAKKLEKRGLHPLFCVGPDEYEDWKYIEDKGFALANISSLSSLAAIVYESGFVIGNDSLIGHLGSNLNLPTLIIANDEKRMRLWRPGWRKGHLVFPPSYLPNWKFLRLREKRWQHFISSKKILKSFDNLLSSL